VIPVSSFSGRRVAVFGLGTSGLATCLALKAGGAEVVALDDNQQAITVAAECALTLTDSRTLDWPRIAALVLSPGVPLTHPTPHHSVVLARAAGVEVIGDLELYCRERRARTPSSPFVAITGTNGKSTTTALLSHVLRGGGIRNQAGGNIGTAILSLEPPDADLAHVIECSSYQIDLAPSLDPLIGVLLNISPDHLDRHGSFERYAGIKERLVAGVQMHGSAIISVDDDWCRAIADRCERAGTKVVRVSTRDRLAQGVEVAAGRINQACPTGVRELASIYGISTLRGLHNAQNAACAVAAALALGLSAESIAQGLRTFPGLAHRMEEVGRSCNVVFINDSKATNAEAARWALASFSDIFWIVGGRPKADGIGGLIDWFPAVRKAYLIGEAAEAFAATLQGKVAYVIAETLDRAVGLAAGDAQASRLPAPVVLLSPACASFDQFPNFEARGARFRELVKALGGSNPPEGPAE
jgi:UDP-N-acetylmuramoylalanine--D-glutamate ligase